MSRRPFRIGRSRTGLGLFAIRLIKKNSRIAEYKGPLLTTKQASKIEANGNRYLYEVNSRWTIDGSPRSNIARYANHSCNPNADSYNVKLRVFIRALRNIKPGEEIVYDYGIDYLKNVIGRSNCRYSSMRFIPSAWLRRSSASSRGVSMPLDWKNSVVLRMMSRTVSITPRPRASSRLPT